MFLERIEITGYRGISRLSLNLNEQTVLIGENSWGKSSLLRSLWCILGNGVIPYEFVAEDFRKDEDTGKPISSELSFVLTFRELVLGSANSLAKLQPLKPAWVSCKDSYNRVFYFIHGTMNKNGTVFTSHNFLDINGNIIHHNLMSQVQHLLLLNPLFRIRDRRAQYKDIETSVINDLPNTINKGTGNSEWVNKIERKISRLFKSYVNTDGEEVPRRLIKEGVRAMEELLEHYFTVIPPLTISALRRYRKNKSHRGVMDIVSRPVSNNIFGSLSTLLKDIKKSNFSLMLTLIAGSIIMAKGDLKIDKRARPIIVFEDFESRLHPTVLINLWNIMEIMPYQKIVTTNSGDLLSSVNLSDIRRMCRSVNATKSMFVDEKKFTSDELRKISFHIRLNRSTSLFARTWIFVEGETEIWLLNEFASLMGINLHAEGIRLVEYAQCGASPLIKLANHLGISWHLLADGDDAGIKYVRQASAHAGADRVTLLPSLDIEHFLYENGFEDVYKQNTGLGSNKGLNEKKIIELAVKKHTKPGMALAVVDDARRKGKRSIPVLFQKMLAKIVSRSVTESIIG